MSSSFASFATLRDNQLRLISLVGSFLEKLSDGQDSLGRVEHRQDCVACTSFRPPTPASSAPSLPSLRATCRGPRKSPRELGIEKAYGSYQELLADKNIDAIYNPLPNHLHVPWSIRALKADKHVLCEKPIGLSVAEAEQLAGVAAAHPKLKIMEAFMVRLHPQWLAARKLVREGRIGELRTIHTLVLLLQRRPRQHPQPAATSAAAR